MALPNSLPDKQGQFAVTAFSRGDVIHNGDVLTKHPTRSGFHAVFRPKSRPFLEEFLYVGPFETSKEAYSIGLNFADFYRVMQID